MDNTPLQTKDPVSPAQPSTPKKRPQTRVQPHDTPSSASSAAASEYSSEIKGREAINHQLGSEIHGSFIGPMPPEQFLEQFLPERAESLPTEYLPSLRFALENPPVSEALLCTSFVQDAPALTKSLHVVDTSNKADEICGLKPDVSFYTKTSPAPTTDDPATILSQVSLIIEFKANQLLDPFDDTGKSTNRCSTAHPFERIKLETTQTKQDHKSPHAIRGQLSSYVSTVNRLQSRTHFFVVCIFGPVARLMRWDAAGTVVSKAFSVCGTSYLAQFLWRFDAMDDADRGCDPTLVRVSDSEAETLAPAEVRTRLSQQNYEAVKYNDYTREGTLIERHDHFCTIAMLVPPNSIPKTDVKATSEPKAKDPLEARLFLVSYPPRIPVAIALSPYGRHVRQMYAYDIKWKKIVTMKQYWRAVSPDSKVPKEDEVYATLKAKSVPHIATVWTACDVLDPRAAVSRSHEYQTGGEGWTPIRCKKMGMLQLYRLCLDTVAIPITEFKSTKELVGVIRDAAKCVGKAHTDALILHRDLGPASIMFDEDKQEGIVVNWDLCRPIGPGAAEEARRREIETTWQFRSAKILRSADIELLQAADRPMHTLGDDLESLFWTLLWVSLFYARNNLRPFQLGYHVSDIFDRRRSHIPLSGESVSTGGDGKRLTLDDSTKLFKILKFPEAPHLRDLLLTLQKRFSLRYITGSYVEFFSQEQKAVIASIEEQATWFIEFVDDALKKDGWPKEDRAQRNEHNPYDVEVSDGIGLRRAAVVELRTQVSSKTAKVSSSDTAPTSSKLRPSEDA